MNTSFEKHLTYSARNDPVSRNLGFPALAWHAAAMRCRRWRHPESFVLVALFVFLSLGDWRSTLIPTLAVPLSLIGRAIIAITLVLTAVFVPVTSMWPGPTSVGQQKSLWEWCRTEVGPTDPIPPRF